MKENKGYVLVLDDDALVRKHLSLLLRSKGYATRVFASGAEFFSQTSVPEHACLLLDVRMPGMGGAEVQKKLLQLGWILPIVFISADPSISVAIKTIQLGALDFLQKPVDTTLILEVIKKALSHSQEMHREHREQDKRKALWKKLTEREQEVFTWVIAGKLNKQIATKLGITERTVKAHRACVMEKLKATSVVSLVRLADRLGIQAGRD